MYMIHDEYLILKENKFLTYTHTHTFLPFYIMHTAAQKNTACVTEPKYYIFFVQHKKISNNDILR